MPFKSKSQVRKFFALERQGKISKKTLNEYLESTPNIKDLPERLEKKSFVEGFNKIASRFTIPGAIAPAIKSTASSGVQKGLAAAKTALKTPKPINQTKGHMDQALAAWNNRVLAKMHMNKVGLDMAAQAALEQVNMADRVPGTDLRESPETGQARGRATRTFNVKNEDREFGQKYRRTADTARGGRIYGTTK